MEGAYGVFSTEEPDADFAALAAGLARAYRATGEFALASERVELALQIAESLSLAETVAQALTTKALTMPDRPFEREGLVGEELEIRAEARLDLAVRRCRFGNRFAELVTQPTADVAQHLEVELILRGDGRGPGLPGRPDLPLRRVRRHRGADPAPPDPPLTYQPWLPGSPLNGPATRSVIQPP